MFVLSWSLLIRGILAAVRQKIHLSPCPDSPGQLSLRMDTIRRRALFKQIEAIEDFAQRPKPHQGTLFGLVTRLAPMLKMARAVEATEIIEDFLKRRTGVR